MAFANSRDGGVIVIGKAEKDDNQFELTGVTPEQAATFENRFAEPDKRPN